MRLLCRLLLLCRKLLLLRLGCSLLPQLLLMACLGLSLRDGPLRFSEALLLCSNSCLLFTPSCADVRTMDWLLLLVVLRHWLSLALGVAVCR